MADEDGISYGETHMFVGQPGTEWTHVCHDDPAEGDGEWNYIGRTAEPMQFGLPRTSPPGQWPWKPIVWPPPPITIELDVSGFRAGVAALAAFVHDLDQLARPRWHRRRCRTCNPAAFATPPSGRAGREYHRRQLARRRRRR